MKTEEQKVEGFFETLGHAGRGGLFLDYDGTLAPFQLVRHEATPYPGIPEILRDIQSTGRTRLVIVTGRAVEDMLPLLGMEPAPEIWGSHGWERRHPDGTRERFPMENRFVTALEEAEALGAHLGRALERKPACLALHWRGRSASEIEALQNSIGRAWQRIAEENGLELKGFDGGLELRAAGRHKGRVVEALLQEMDGPGTALAYLGDDLTDEDAFAALEGRGLRVLVRREARPTRADCRIEPPEGLFAFLKRWRDATVSNR